MARQVGWYICTIQGSRGRSPGFGKETSSHGADFGSTHLGVDGALAGDGGWGVIYGLERSDASKGGGV